MAGREVDNLEYYIKFPHSGHDHGQKGDNDFVFVVNETKVPVVLLFGWAGCQDKYLSKYSQIYENKGLITLRYTAPVKCLFWKRFHMIAIGEKIVKLLIDMNFEKHPIIVHCFSNGGAFLYQHFSLAIENSSKPIQIKGVIFDSAPGKRRLVSLFKAISAILGGNPLYNFSISVLITAFISTIWFWEIIKNYIFPAGTFRHQSNLMESLKREKNLWPQHFIYSKTDELIPCSDIEHFIELRREIGVEVSNLRFESSDHVKHYIQHKNEYTNSVYDFLNKCLQ